MLLLLTPIVGTAITLIFERAGISGRLREQEFYHKRVELIEKILAMQVHFDPDKKEQDVFNALSRELKNIILYLEDTSSKVMDNRSVFGRFFSIRTDRPGASVLILSFYLYLLIFVGMAVVLGFYPDILPSFLFPEWTPFTRISFPLLLLLATLYIRYYAYRTYKRRPRSRLNSSRPD